jgi:hypothetical protein
MEQRPRRPLLPLTPAEPKNKHDDFIRAAQAARFKDRAKRIEDIAGELTQGEDIHYWNRGNIPTYDMLLFLAQKTGPADLYFSTWGLSVESILLLKSGLELGIFKSIHAVLSRRLRHTHKAAYRLAEAAFTTVATAEIHAKCSVLENEEWCLTLFGSSNFTRNPRYERNCICTNKEVSLKDKAFLENLLLNAAKP